MWKATIARTERNLTTLNIVIVYSNGTIELSETLSTPNSQSPDWVNNQIVNRLKQLTDLDNFQQIIQVNNPVTTSYIIDSKTQQLTVYLGGTV